MDAAPSDQPHRPLAPRDSGVDAAGVSDVLEQMRQIVADLDLSSGGLQDLEGPRLGQAVLLAEEVGQVLDILRVRLAYQADRYSKSPGTGRSFLKQVGARNSIDFLQRATGLAAGTLSRRVKLGKYTSQEFSLTGAPIEPRFPAVAAGLDSGRLSVEAAETVIRHLDRPTLQVKDLAQDVAVAEIGLVESATGTGPREEWAYHTDGLRVMCQVVATYLDQDGAKPLDRDLLVGRSLRLGKERNGLVPLSGDLVPDVAALLARVLEAVTNPQNPGKPPDPLGPKMGCRACGLEALRCPSHKANVVHESHCSAGSTQDESIGAGSILGQSAVADNLTGPQKVDQEDIHAQAATECSDCAAFETQQLGALLDTRTFGMKNHDAFASLLGTFARNPETPLIGGAPVTVLVQTTETYAREHAAGTAQSSTAILNKTRSNTDLSSKALAAAATLDNAGSGRSHLDGASSNPVHAGDTKPLVDGVFLHGHDGQIAASSRAFLDQAACAGGIQRIVTTVAGAVAKIETTNRIFDSNQRRAFILRDGGCIIPGCTVPPTWCEAHHVIEWSDGGPTSTDNGVLLCWAHHRRIELNGWKIRIFDGVPYVQAEHWIDPEQRWRRVRPPTAVPNFQTTEIQELCAKLFTPQDELQFGTFEDPAA